MLYISPMTEREPKTETRTVLFREGNLFPALTGERQITLRKYRPEAHDFKTGELFVGSFKDGLDILLQATADTEVKTFNDLSDEEAREDGFKDAEDAFNGMHEYYPDLTPDTRLAIVRFEVAKINGIPSVRANINYLDS